MTDLGGVQLVNLGFQDKRNRPAAARRTENEKPGKAVSSTHPGF